MPTPPQNHFLLWWPQHTCDLASSYSDCSTHTLSSVSYLDPGLCHSTYAPQADRSSHSHWPHRYLCPQPCAVSPDSGVSAPAMQGSANRCSLSDASKVLSYQFVPRWPYHPSLSSSKHQLPRISQPKEWPLYCLCHICESEFSIFLPFLSPISN